MSPVPSRKQFAFSPSLFSTLSLQNMDVATETSYVTLDEVRRHASNEDCWIIVHSKVYDVSNFHSEHPGGAAIILKYAGTDATTAYDEIHAPGIIGDTLPEDCHVGLINAQEMADLQEQTKVAAGETAALQAVAVQQAQPVAFSEPKTYEKPDLFKLISVHDFEDVARNTLTEKAWAFFSSAATDLVTHHNNSDYYRKIMIRPRILRNVKEISIKRRIMGCESSAPFFISPAAMAKLAHPEGELAMARGAATEDIIQCVSESNQILRVILMKSQISSNASYPLEDIVRAGSPGQPFFLQLYVNSDRPKSAELLHKARKLGIKAIFVTVDAPVPGKREADERIATQSNVVSAISGARGDNDKKGGGMGRLMAKYVDSTLNWEDIKWIKETSGLPVVLKGVQTAADAKKAVEYGCDGIMLSNHGGRSLDT